MKATLFAEREILKMKVYIVMEINTFYGKFIPHTFSTMRKAQEFYLAQQDTTFSESIEVKVDASAKHLG